MKRLSIAMWCLFLLYPCWTSADETSGPSEQEVAAAAKIAQAGGVVRRIAQSVETNEVSFAYSREKVTDESLADLAEVPNVEWLYLQGTDITDAGLEQVGKLVGLTKLHLEKTKIGDDGLKHLKPLKNLEYLNLYGTNVTNDGLKSLQNMASLKKLYLWQTKVDEEGITKLKAILPDATIMAAAKPLITPKPKTIAIGQFVRVRLTGKQRMLSLAEVEVFDDNGAPIHTSGSASASSVDYEGEPKRALDGVTDGNYEKKSVTHTALSDYPWWQVDLGETKPISKIVVWNRSEFGDRLDKARLEVLDADHQVIWERMLRDVKDGSSHEFVAE